jgi:hypothetical protein
MMMMMSSGGERRTRRDGGLGLVGRRGWISKLFSSFWLTYIQAL